MSDSIIMKNLYTYSIFFILCFTRVNSDDLISVSEYSSDILPSFLNLFTSLVPDVLNSTSLVKLAVDAAILTTDYVFDEFEYLLPPALPEVDQNIWWGDGDSDTDDTTINEFTISLSEERIQRLKTKIKDREIFVAPLINSNFSYGMNSDVLNDFLERWVNEYDFESRQKVFNQFPQFITQVQGLNIHYIHVKPQSTSKTVIPLLMIHGAPLSNLEYIHMYSALSTESDDYDFVFEIIAPSIPGYGYSQGTSKIGQNTYQTAIIFKNLMTRLGFEKFYIHCGDFGQPISTDMSVLYPDDVLGMHTNFGYTFMPKTLVKWLIGSMYPHSVAEEQYIDRMYPLSDYYYFVITFFGYFHEQATKPDTVGVALTDSPSGLASWVGTLFVDLASKYYYDGETGVLGDYNVTDIYDSLTIIWDSEAVVTAMRLYSEYTAWVQDPVQWAIIQNPTSVPYAVTKFLHEIVYMPDEFLMDKYTNLVYSDTVDFGTHWISFENPALFATKIRNAIKALIEFNNIKLKL